jgi:hemerythrin-like domain-containing protein
MKAIDMLMEEHEVIHKVLDVLERMAQRADSNQGVHAAHGRMIVEFLHGFADTCHHAKEEQHLFPALLPHGLTAQSGPVAVMLAEHAQGRELVVQLEQAVQAVDSQARDGAARFSAAAWAYISLLRGHIAKENQVLFPMAAQLLTDVEAQALLDAFHNVEHKELGVGAHEKYLEIASTLAAACGVG